MLLSSTNHSSNRRVTVTFITPTTGEPLRPAHPDIPITVHGPSHPPDARRITSLRTPSPRSHLELACQHPTSSLFNQAQARPASQLAPSAWGATVTSSQSAQQALYGMDHGFVVREPSRAASSTQVARPSAQTGNGHQAAQLPITTLVTNVQDVENRIMALSSVLELRKSKAHTPLIAGAWHRLLTSTGLICKYPTVPHGIQFGFDAGIQPIVRTSTPPNKPSIQIQKEEFAKIIGKEFSRGRYIGPLSRLETERLIGPFQSSPLDLTPKAGQAGKFRLIQNLSFPHIPLDDSYSINHSIDSDQFPCTWGTFSVICLLISRLPPGSQAAVRDVAEAYRTIPVTPTQWPGLVVRLQGEDCFAIDTSDCFGLTSSAGTYGVVADAGADIARAHGIGPMSKWVDDHIFFRIRKEYIQEYNGLRRKWNTAIIANGGQIHDGGRLWYCGDTMPDDRPEEFDEDAGYPLLDLSLSSPRSAADEPFTYSMEDIDRIYSELGVPWETTKDVPFATSVPFIGFIWDIAELQVSIPTKKKTKYLEAIQEWLLQPTHTLEEVRKLYRKLLHACLVIPAGRAYLTSLEAFLGIFHDRPFMPRTAPRNTADDLLWWSATLARPNLVRSIPGPQTITDVEAYSDASSATGIGITIGKKWRAWRLLPGWNADGRDIGWAEAIGFELLIESLLASHPPGSHLKVYGDNRGVVEGWWKGKSRNKPTNMVFRRIHQKTVNADCTIHSRYVRSRDNPADGPSRGIYPPHHDLLPRIHIIPELQKLIADFDAELNSH